MNGFLPFLLGLAILAGDEAAASSRVIASSQPFEHFLGSVETGCLPFLDGTIPIRGTMTLEEQDSAVRELGFVPGVPTEVFDTLTPQETAPMGGAILGTKSIDDRSVIFSTNRTDSCILMLVSSGDADDLYLPIFAKERWDDWESKGTATSQSANVFFFSKRRDGPEFQLTLVTPISQQASNLRAIISINAVATATD